MHMSTADISGQSGTGMRSVTQWAFEQLTKEGEVDECEVVEQQEPEEFACTA